MSTIEQVPSKHVGRSLRRKEDPRLITGRAQYVDDITLHGMLHLAVVRSPEAHARITSIDTSAASAMPGVTAVFTGEDMSDLPAPLPMAWAPPGVEMKMPERWPLARGTVNHVGDAVAMVVGEDKYAVADAAQAVVVEYEPLPVVVDVEEALKDEVLVHESLGTNKTHEWSMGGGDVDAAIAEADVVVEQRIVNHRIAGAPIEPRGVIAEYRAGSLTVWSSTQVPHLLRLFFAVQMGIPEDHVRCIAPEVGGGFGGKLQITAEETLCAWASKRLGRPVKWIETRSENMAVSHHGRDQVDYVRMAASSDGTITAFHANIIQDCGAYFGMLTPMIPELGAFVHDGLLQDPERQDRHHGRPDEQVHHRRDPRRGAPGDDAHARGDDRPARAEARHGPDRAAAQELHRAGGLPVRDALRHHVRLGQLRGDARPRAGDARHGRPSAPSRRRCDRRASCAASASRRTRRSAASRRRARSGRRASASGSACTSRR